MFLLRLGVSRKVIIARVQGNDAVRILSAEGLKAMLERGDDVHLIDVLPRVAFEKQHIPGALNVSLYDDGFLERIGAIVGDREAAVVVYCASRSCNASEKAARKLTEAGYAKVFDFEGGAKEWEAAGHPLVRGGPGSR